MVMISRRAELHSESIIESVHCMYMLFFISKYYKIIIIQPTARGITHRTNFLVETDYDDDRTWPYFKLVLIQSF